MNSNKKLSNIIALIISLLTINQVFILTNQLPQLVYYIVFSILLFIILITSQRIKISPLILLILLSGLLSLVINKPPAVYRSWERLLSFVILVSCIGPLIKSRTSAEVKVSTFRITNILLVVLVSLSTIVYLFKIQIPHGHGQWSGLFVHSMILGPLAAVTVILGIYLFMKHNSENRSLKLKIVDILVIILSIASCLLASSRIAVLAVMAGVLFFFFKLYRRKLSKFWLIVASIIVIITVTFPLWSELTTGLRSKIENSEKSGDSAITRRHLWDKRVEEFKISPVFGIGFASEEIEQNKKGKNNVSGIVEPGSSWLAILSMIGIIGFLPILYLFLKNIYFLFRDEKNILESGALGGVLILFMIHMIAEGYFLASGGYLFFYVWLLLGVIEIHIHTEKTKII